MLIWAPHPSLTDSKSKSLVFLSRGNIILYLLHASKCSLNPSVDVYLETAKTRHGYNIEQALGMLFWHKHNVEKALVDLPNFTPYPDDWSIEDKVLFEQAFQFHGKSFHRIRQMVRT